MRVPTVVVAIMIVVALPVMIPIAMLSYVLETRRLRTAANRLPCPMCGRPLGTGAVALADSTWRAYVAELRRSSPGVRLRLVRLYHAICPACGQQLKFSDSTKTFLPLASPQVVTLFPTNEASAGDSA